MARPVGSRREGEAVTLNKKLDANFVPENIP
jgi:hypothetical protein